MFGCQSSTGIEYGIQLGPSGDGVRKGTKKRKEKKEPWPNRCGEVPNHA